MWHPKPVKDAAYKASHEMQVVLNKIDPSFFPIPFTEVLLSGSFIQSELKQATTNTYVEKPPPNAIHSEFLMRVNALPIGTAGIDRSEILETQKSLDIFKISPAVEKLIEEYNKKKTEISADEGKLYYFKQISLMIILVPVEIRNLTTEEAEIVFLGTGAAIPFKLRNGKLRRRVTFYILLTLF